jgi:CheY-like chemotaxis protein
MIDYVNRSVLAVDDVAFRKLPGRLLTASGLRVVGATDSVAAARAAALQPTPSAVPVDVGLPDGDGLALERELAGLPWRPSVVLRPSDPDHDSVSRSRSLQSHLACAVYRSRNAMNPVGLALSGP